MYWVLVSCEFQCRACGHVSPLNYLDLDGSVRCLRCGLDQAFARASWRTALEHAHAVGDLAGSTEGRHPHPLFSIASENPFRGQRRASHRQSGFVSEGGVQVPTSLHLSAELGQPSCEKCRAALVVQRTTPGEIRSSCPGCGEHRSYRLPPEAHGLLSSLVGVMANEHRSDCPATRIESDAARPGAVALACPGCGAHLELAEGRRFATCSYCRTTSRIPEKTLYRTGSATAAAEPFWLAFEGRSTLRRKLERDPGVALDDDDLKHDLKVQVAPKQKRMPPLELALVVLLPLLILAGVAGVDLLLLGGLELDIGL